MVKKLQLDYEDDNEYYYLGISSSINDYQLVFDLNKHLNMNFRRVEAFRFSNNGEEFTYSLYTYIDDDNMVNYYLLANKDVSKRLIPQFKHIDFILIVEGEIIDEEVKTLARDIKKLSRVMLASQLSADNFDKIKGLRYEFDLHLEKVFQNM
ncbi:MAG: IPExxxVDY family protein [Bacteroidetes bacterium]|nr:MAG: IPExxxVDY family protein [Bacteroidota bacterium]